MSEVSKGGDAYGFTEEDDVRLDQTFAFRTLRNFPCLEGVPHLVTVKFATALYAVLACKATVCLDDLAAWYACPPLERIYVLREACAQELVVIEEAHEGVGLCGPKTPRQQLMRERVDYVMHRFDIAHNLSRVSDAHRLSGCHGNS